MQPVTNTDTYYYFARRGRGGGSAVYPFRVRPGSLKASTEKPTLKSHHHQRLANPAWKPTGEICHADSPRSSITAISIATRTESRREEPSLARCQGNASAWTPSNPHA